MACRKRQPALRRVRKQGGGLVDPARHFLHRQLVSDDAGRGNEHFWRFDAQVLGGQGAHLACVGQAGLSRAGVGIAGVDHDAVGLAALEVLPADLNPRRDDLVRGKHGGRRRPRRACENPQIRVPRHLDPRRNTRPQEPLRGRNTVISHNVCLIPSHSIQVPRPLHFAAKSPDSLLTGPPIAAECLRLRRLVCHHLWSTT